MEHEALIKRLGTLTKGEQEAVREFGGTKQLKQRVRMVEMAAAGLEWVGEEEPEDHWPEDEQAEMALTSLRSRQEAEFFATEADAMNKVLVKVGEKETDSTTVDALIDLWEKVKRPKHNRAAERVRQYVSRFTGVVGVLDIKNITQLHVVKFRDWLSRGDLSESSQLKHMDHLRSIFAVAVDEGLLPSNPASGIKVRRMLGKHVDRIRRKPFTGEQVMCILNLAETHLGVDGAWAVRMCAYHGCRIGEVCQLRKEDVRVDDGIAIIDIHDAHGARATSMTLVKNYSRKNSNVRDCWVDLSV